MSIKVCVLELNTSNYEGERLLPEKFIKALQLVVDSGGSILGIISASLRCKKAIVQVPEYVFTSNPKIFKES